MAEIPASVAVIFIFKQIKKADVMLFCFF